MYTKINVVLSTLLYMHVFLVDRTFKRTHQTMNGVHDNVFKSYLKNYRFEYKESNKKHSHFALHTFFFVHHRKRKENTEYRYHKGLARQKKDSRFHHIMRIIAIDV